MSTMGSSGRIPNAARHGRRRRVRHARAGLLAVALLAATTGAAIGAVTRGEERVEAADDVPRQQVYVVGGSAAEAAPFGAFPPPVPALQECEASGPARAVNRAQGTSRVVALTFDDGPWPGSTAAILRILERRSVKATFFAVGTQAATQPAMLRAIERAGHAIGDHSWAHSDLAEMKLGALRSDLDRTSAAITRATGVQTCIFRAPYGSLSRDVVLEARERGMVTVGWDVDSKDYMRPGTKQIIRNVLGSVRAGSIVLMHDGGGNRVQTVAALNRIITAIRRRNLTLVTVPELLRLRTETAGLGRSTL